MKRTVKKEWGLTGRLLHCKRKIALQVIASIQYIYPLRGCFERDRTFQSTVALSLNDEYRDEGRLARRLVIHRPVVCASNIEAILRLDCWRWRKLDHYGGRVSEVIRVDIVWVISGLMGGIKEHGASD